MIHINTRSVPGQHLCLTNTKIKTMNKLNNKVAVITGTAAGIGRAASLLFAAEGASIAAIDRDEALNAKVVEEVRSQGGNAEAYTADVSSARDI